MASRLSEKELKEMAQQLSCPSGDEGIVMGETMNTGNSGMTMNTIKNLDLKEGECILELGHGNCGHLAEILQQTKNIKYTGIEVSETMCEQAALLNSPWVENQRAVFKQYNGITLPFSDQAFDKIMTVNTIYFWEDAEKLLSEIYRVLKPEGTFIVTYAQKEFMKKLPFTQYGFRLYDNEDVMALVATTNLKIAEMVESSEEVVSKTGETVQRFYTMAKLYKLPETSLT